MYGGSLPRSFFDSLEADAPTADLLIVAGTSLTVSPANQIPLQVPEECVRVVVDRERVGADMGMFADGRDDVFLGGRGADEVFLSLCRELGWLEEMREFVGVLPEGSAAMLEV